MTNGTIVRILHTQPSFPSLTPYGDVPRTEGMYPGSLPSQNHFLPNQTRLSLSWAP